MIRYISSFSVNTLHSMVNCGLLRMLALTCPDTDLLVETTSSSADTLAKALDGTGVSARFRKLGVNCRPGRVALLARYLQSAFHNVAALFRSRRNDTIIYNFNNVFSLGLINCISRRLLRHRHIIIVCHGELEYLANSGKHTKAYKRLMCRLTKRFFTGTKPSALSPDINFIVLGDVILDELKPYIPDFMAPRFHSVDHPVTLPPANTVGSHRSDKIRLGTVGILNRYKGSDAYLRLLDRFKGNYGRLEFSAVGQVQSDLDEFRRRGITLAANPAEPLPDEEFNAMVSELDYILLFYPADNYRLIASGALLDTLRFRKPLIALSTVYFRYFFKKFGSVGYLAADEHDMAHMIEHLTSTDASGFNFSQAIEALSPEALAPGLGKILDACGCADSTSVKQ